MKAWMRFRGTAAGKDNVVPLEVGLEQREDTIVLTIRTGLEHPKELDIWVLEGDFKKFLTEGPQLLAPLERPCFDDDNLDDVLG